MYMEFQNILMSACRDMGKKHKKCPLGEVLGKGCSPDKKLEKSQISSKVLFPGNQ